MRLSRKVHKQHRIIAIIQAIVLFLVIFVTALSAQRSTSQAATLRISRVRARNNPLYTNRRAVYSLKYRLNANSIIYVKVSKGSKYYRTFKMRRRRGYNIVRWNGRDNYGHVVPRGTYKLKVYAKRRRALSKPIYMRINVRNDLLFADYFDRPNGLIADAFGHNDPQQNWVVTNQWLYAKNKRGYIPAKSPTFRLVTKNSSFTNFNISTNLMVANYTNGQDLPAKYSGFKIFFRWHDQYNLYVASVQKNGTVVLEKKVNNVYTYLGSRSIGSFQLNKWYKMKVVANGQNLQVWLDGTKYIDVNDSSWSNGRVGVRSDNVVAYFDNYVVYGL